MQTITSPTSPVTIAAGFECATPAVLSVLWCIFLATGIATGHNNSKTNRTGGESGYNRQTGSPCGITAGSRKRDQMLGGQKRGTASRGRKNKLEWYIEWGHRDLSPGRKDWQCQSSHILIPIMQSCCVLRDQMGLALTLGLLESLSDARAHSSQGCRRSTSSMPSASAAAAPLDACGACLAARPACEGVAPPPARASSAAVAAVRAACGLLTWLCRPLSRSSASDSMLLASLGEKLPANPGAALPGPPTPSGDGAGASAAAGCCCMGGPGACMLASPPGAAAKADAGWRAGLPKLVGALPCTLQSTCRAVPRPAQGPQSHVRITHTWTM